MARKISTTTARKVFRNSHNRGEAREAQTLFELDCIQYNPLLKGTEGGDVVLRDGTHVQVKAFDGVIRTHITGDLQNDITQALTEDGSTHWVIWYNSTTYLYIEKSRLLTYFLKYTDELLRYNVRDGRTTLRLKMGPQKRKLFYYEDNRTATQL